MKKFLAFFLAVVMLLGSFPVNAIHVHAAEAEYTLVRQHVVPGVELPDSDALYAAYAQQVLYGNSISMLGTAAGDRLTGDAKILYDAVVPILKQIAAGQRESAVVGVGSTVSYDGTTYTADVEAEFSSASLDDGATQELMDALLSDLPYEMYWFDKVSGISVQTLSTSTRILHVQLCFTVADNYKGADDYTTDTAKTGAAAEAAANAHTIVSAYAAKSDYEKLLGYKTEICALVSYDQDAADTGTFSEDNDPWQLIHVFDSDSSTNVVCEGYSKAFMYLCDLTAFSGDVSCYTVTGVAGGPHMWNIVTIGGGNYLADVTNSDSGTIGADGSLFLAGTAGSAGAGYTFGDLTYTYDSDTMSLWGTGEDSILTLADTAYVPGEDTEEPIASGTCGDNLTWVLTEDGVLTISGEGAMENGANPGAYTWYAYRTSVTAVQIGSGVTSIGDFAFPAYTNLTSVTVEGHLTRIGQYAFAQNDCLETFSASQGADEIDAYAFSQCTALRTVELSDSMTAMGRNAFYACSSLTDFDIPVGLTTIPELAFYGCSSLTEITIPDGVTYLGLNSFANCSGLTEVSIPEGVTALGSDVFSRCTGLKSVSIPSSVTSIGSNAFYECASLTSVTIPQGVTQISDRTFYKCSALSEVKLPEGIATIGDSAFFACEALAGMTLSSTLTEIAASAFYGCSTLTEITFPQNLASIGENAFSCCILLDTIVFTGEAPAIGTDAFNMVTADAYYPDGVDSWTEEVMQDYGGAITWEPYSTVTEVASGTCGNNLTWVLTDDYTLTISGTGDMDDFTGSDQPWDDYTQKITAVVMEDGATSVGDYAFFHCYSITAVDLPDSVQTIGVSTFFYCNHLTEIQLPAGLTVLEDNAFGACYNLEKADLPDGLVTIGEDVFAGSLLTSAVIPDSVTTIGQGAFQGCPLTQVEIPASVTEIGYQAFENCAPLTYISVDPENTAYCNDAQGAMYNKDCTTLIVVPGGFAGEFVIPETVTTVEASAFAYCRELTAVDIPDSVTEIGEDAFYECDKLVSVVLPDSITEIKRFTFGGCGSLAIVTIPESVTAIGQSAFWECTSLEQIDLPDGLTTLGSGAFNDCTALRSIVIPAGITELASSAFIDCDALAEVVLPDGITTIGNWCFGNCVSLTEITLPDTVQTIGYCAFNGCTALTEITIPASVTTLVNHCFAYAGLTAITFLGDAPTFGNDKVFLDVTATAYYPEGNDTWTEDVMQDYGGTITWEAYTPECTEHSYTSVVTAPTCTEQGYTTYTCSNCGESYVSDYVDALGHDYEGVVTEPSCSGHGYTTYTCANCGDSYVSDYVDALGHDYEGVVTEPSCSGHGYTTYTCANCGDSYVSDYVDPVDDHDYISVVTAPTCTEAGYTTYTCAACDYSYVGDYVDALGHTSGEAVMENKVDATCESAGSYESVVYCSVCSEELSRETVTIPATGHLYRSTVTAPDCTGQGNTTHTCSRCGDSYVDSYVDALGHTSAEPVVENKVDATCESAGSYESVVYCSACGEEVSRETVTIPVAAHSYSASVTAPDCTGQGYTTYTCSRCGDSYVDDYVDALGHEMGEWFSEGNNTECRYCARCDYYETRATEIFKPDAPVVTLSNVASSGKIKISWNAVEGAARYQVWRSTDGENWSLLKTVTGTSLTNTSTTAGTLYQYYVVAVAEDGTESDKSELMACTCDLPQPSISSLTIISSTGKIKIKWGAVEGAQKYELYCSTDNVSWKKLTTTTGTTINHNSAVAGTKYYYKVRAISSNSEANSAYSAVKSGTCDLARPTIKSLTIVASTGKIKIKWGAVEGAQKYELYCSTDSKTWKKLTTTTGTSITHSSGVAGTKYYYKVRAISSNASANSAYSAVKSGTCDLPRPVAQATLNSSGKPVISWNKVSGAVKYTLYIYDVDGNLLKTSSTTGTKITHSSAESGTTYKYRVVAVHTNTSANSAKSSTISATAR